MSISELSRIEPSPGDADRRGTELTAAVYRYAAGNGVITGFDTVAAELSAPVADVIAAVTRLVELHLLRTDGPLGARLVPVDPGTATALAVNPLERAMYQHRELTDRLRERIGAVGEPATGPIDHVEGVVEIRGLLKLAGDVCRREVAILRPAGDDDVLDELLDPCFRVLERGIAVRMVGPHRTRADFAVRAKAVRLAGAGVELRTLSRIPQPAVVFDREIAVVLTLPGDDPASDPAPGEPAARRIGDETVVGFLSDLFDQMWDGAIPFAAVEPGYAGAVDDLQRAVARLLAEGHTDDVIARRLGMSVRTCRRHVAALLQNLGSVSRFQAGVHAARHLSLGVAPA